MWELFHFVSGCEVQADIPTKCYLNGVINAPPETPVIDPSKSQKISLLCFYQKM